MAFGQLPQFDREPQTELLIVETTSEVVTSAPVPIIYQHENEFVAIIPAPPLSTTGLWLMGDIVLRMWNIKRPVPSNYPVDYFSITIGSGATAYPIVHEFHPWTDCDEHTYLMENAYPQSALADNFFIPDPDEPFFGGYVDGLIVVFVRWQGGLHDFYTPCNSESVIQVELHYERVVQTQETEPRDLQLWGEDLCQNVVFAPCLPPLGHNRKVGFFDDNGAPIPGQHPLPENFCGLLSTHSTRMVEEAASASEEVCKPSYASMVIAPDGYAKGYYCSQPESLDPRRFQQNHYAHPFVQMGANDTTGPSPLEKDWPVSREVPKGFCGFIGAYHAPRWTELLYYSRREICGGIL